MAVLEAFVHDPLLNWRLLGVDAPSDTQEPDTEVAPVDSLNRPTATALSRKQSNLLMNTNKTDAPEVETVPEVLNEKAVEVITRVQQKLTGTDFHVHSKLTVEEQV